MLNAMKRYADTITGVVAVTDSGRSTGRLREDFSIPAMGDLRNCLAALANQEEIMQKLFQHRFQNGDLEGHSFGNLFLTALTQVTGSFRQAVAIASDILNVDGRVLPATLKDVDLKVTLENGETLVGENTIVARNDRELQRSPIKTISLTEPAPINGEAAKALREADVIIIGPGQLYTSVISPLLKDGVQDAFEASDAQIFFVCNIMTVAAQTDGYSVEDHVDAVENYLGAGMIDTVIYNTRVPPEDALEPYHAEKAFMVEHDADGERYVGADVLEDVDGKRMMWEKQDWLRHDPEKVADTILDLL